jgi:hypothetical protein
MSPRDSSSRSDLEAWRVGALRLTAFTDPLAPLEARAEGKRWEALVGKPPENVISRMFGMEHEENGPFPAGGKLTYKRSPRGIEWFLESLADPEKPETWFGESTAVLMPFKDLMSQWIIDGPSLRRLAFGAAFYREVADKEEGYRLLGAWLRMQLDPVNSGDFLYQINRRRPTHSGVPNLEINRLSKWTWVQLGLRGLEGEQLWPGVHPSACLLELDINTAPEFSVPLPRETYAPLLGELVAFAEEIALQGDVP